MYQLNKIKFSILLVMCICGYIFAQTPVINSLSSNSASIEETITITGIDLDSITGISLEGEDLSISNYAVISNTDVSITIPYVFPGDYMIVITTSGGVSNSQLISIVATDTQLPTITGVSFIETEVDDVITLTGYNLISISGIDFGTTNADISTLLYLNPSQVSIAIPVISSIGNNPIKVSNTAGNSENFDFTISGLNKPFINAITPSFGKVGDYVTIDGLNIETITGVVIGNTIIDAASITQINSNSFLIQIPYLSPGSNDIIVDNVRGSSLPVSFTIVQSGPTITSIFPLEIKVGEKITITGSNFSISSIVVFNTITTTGFRLLSNSKMEVTAPNGNATGTIKITTPFGTTESIDTVTVNENKGIGNTATGINLSLDETSSISIFPIPSKSGIFNTNLSTEFDYEVYDLIGNKRKEASHQHSICIEEVENGVYFVKIKLPNKAFITKKLIVQR